jgi:hypothetical protein
MDTHMRTNYYEQMATVLKTRKPYTYGAAGLAQRSNRCSEDPEAAKFDASQTSEASQLLTNPDGQEEVMKSFIHRCIRRQVELAMFLPIRRDVFKLIFPFIALQALNMQKALDTLQSAPTSFFGIPQNIEQTQMFPKAVKAFKEVINAYIPSDQGQLLLITANTIMELYSECKRLNAVAAHQLAVQRSPSVKDRENSRSVSSVGTSNTNISSSGSSADGKLGSHRSVSTDNNAGSQKYTKVLNGDSNNGESQLPSEFHNFEDESGELSSSVTNWQKLHKTASSVTEASALEAGGSVHPEHSVSALLSANSRPLDLTRFSVKMSSPTIAPISNSMGDQYDDAVDDDKIVIADNADKVVTTESHGGIGTDEYSEEDVHHVEFCDALPSTVAVSADDFLPIFTFVMVS